jgi:hypothetical protein
MRRATTAASSWRARTSSSGTTPATNRSYLLGDQLGSEPSSTAVIVRPRALCLAWEAARFLRASMAPVTESCADHSREKHAVEDDAQPVRRVVDGREYKRKIQQENRDKCWDPPAGHVVSMTDTIWA